MYTFDDVVRALDAGPLVDALSKLELFSSANADTELMRWAQEERAGYPTAATFPGVDQPRAADLAFDGLPPYRKHVTATIHVNKKTILGPIPIYAGVETLERCDHGINLLANGCEVSVDARTLSALISAIRCEARRRLHVMHMRRSVPVGMNYIRRGCLSIFGFVAGGWLLKSDHKIRFLFPKLISPLWYFLVDHLVTMVRILGIVLFLLPSLPLIRSSRLRLEIQVSLSSILAMVAFYLSGIMSDGIWSTWSSYAQIASIVSVLLIYWKVSPRQP